MHEKRRNVVRSSVPSKEKFHERTMGTQDDWVVIDVSPCQGVTREKEQHPFWRFSGENEITETRMSYVLHNWSFLLLMFPIQD